MTTPSAARVTHPTTGDTTTTTEPSAATAGAASDAVAIAAQAAMKDSSVQSDDGDNSTEIGAGRMLLNFAMTEREIPASSESDEVIIHYSQGVIARSGLEYESQHLGGAFFDSSQEGTSLLSRASGFGNLTLDFGQNTQSGAMPTTTSDTINIEKLLNVVTSMNGHDNTIDTLVIKGDTTDSLMGFGSHAHTATGTQSVDGILFNSYTVNNDGQEIHLLIQAQILNG